ncbi:ATP-binding protein [Phenylobacterium sp.]|uniref:ATP-binding protein n=1 Tax=Phenylobacterium sp. TaxID=1871053 RepID=UPI003568FC80
MPPHTSQPLTDSLVAAGGHEQAFDVRTSRALGLASRPGRLIFATLYALMSLGVLPLQTAGLWLSAVFAWELASKLVLDRVLERLGNEAAITAYGVGNFLGSWVFSTIALLGLADGSPIGVAIATTWLGGAFMNNFVYFGANRRLLWTSLAPGIAITLIGPTLAHGVGLQSTLISAMILAALVAAQRYALDHRAVVRQLADRQVAMVDLERKLSIAVEASGDGLFELDLVADELHANPSWLAMLGYGPGELGPAIAGWRAFVHPDDLPQLQSEYEAHYRGETPHTTSELRMLCKDGAYKWVLSRARLVAQTADGRPARMVGTCIDISTRKALEHQLESARDLAESANDAKSVFVANMSHEIRTPLNGVIGIAGALARTRLSAAQREMVGLVQSSGQMLERMLSDILDQAKIEAGKFQLQTAPFDLRREIDTAAELMRARADEKGLALRINYAAAAGGLFEGDAVRIRQIVSNLASNAIKFTTAGEVTVGVATRGRASPGAPATVTIRVSDTGIGFDAETGARLFNRFVQADGSISRRFGGTGLGLSICKSLTELMGGTISASSEPGTGSVFTVELPLTRATAAAGASSGPELDAGTRPIAKARILLAEDHPTNQRVVQLVLEPAGVELTVVGNGQEAVDIFRPGLFDLILMDMQMPVMDGLTATRAIRALERQAGGPATPIAMFTANAMDEHAELATEAGADHRICKPITPERLLADVEAALAAGSGAERPRERARRV